VGAGNGDALLEAHQFGQHHRPRHHRNMLVACRDDFRVGLLHRSRGDDHVGASDVLGGMGAVDARAQFRQPLRYRVVCQVGSRHRIAQVQQHLGDTAHANATDADKVDLFDGVFHSTSPVRRKE
jgi:hypothetical protein